MKRLYEFATKDLFDLDYACSCGARHAISIPPIATENLEGEISGLLKTGHVLLLTCDDVDQASLSRLEKSLLGLGYKVTKISLLPFSQEIEEEIGEDVRLVVSYGGSSLIELGKHLSAVMGIRHVAVPVSLDYGAVLEPRAHLKREGGIAVCEGKLPDLVYIDYDGLIRVGEDALASGYGRVLSKLVACFDYYFSGKIYGTVFCPEIMNAVLRSITRLLFQDGDVRSGYSVKLLSDSALRLAIFERLAGGLWGGEYQLGTTIERYLFTATRDKRLFGENLFISSVVVSGLYRSFLSKRAPLCPPPDRSRSVVGMRRLLLIPDTFSLATLRGYEGKFSVDEFKLSIYREELCDMADKIALLVREGLRLIRRIYSDAGFFMKYYLGAEEMLRLLSLSPDYTERPTLLTYVKDSGVLEKYAV